MDSILNSIKKLLGASLDDTSSDAEITMHINDAFMTLNQLGVGPAEGFVISGDTEAWSSYTTIPSLAAGVCAYIFVCVKLIWDPPATSFVLEAYQKKKAEGEARLPLQVPKEVT